VSFGRSSIHIRSGITPSTEERLDELGRRVTILETYLKVGIGFMVWISMVASGILIDLVMRGV